MREDEDTPLAPTSDLEDEVAGRQLVVVLVRCLRTVSVHELTNAAVPPLVRELHQTLSKRLEASGSAAIQCVGENVYYNRELVKPKGDAFEAVRRLRSVYARLRINELSFSAGLEAADLDAFLAAFQQHYRTPTPWELSKEKVPRVSIRAFQQAGAAVIDARMQVARCFAQLIVRVEECYSLMRANQRPPLARLRRAMQSLADAAIGHESLLVGLTRFRKLAGDLAFHAATVASFVLLMGLRLRLAKRDLMRLAMNALFHDIGRESDLPEATVALRSALHIGRWVPSSDALDRVTVTFESTLPMHGSAGMTPGMSARLIAVPCAFERLTNPAGGRSLLPDRALRLLFDDAGKRFDLRVVRLFAATAGLYPVGSLVRLSGGQRAVVMEVPEDPNSFARPIVKVIFDGGPTDYIVDLSGPVEGLSIVESLDAKTEEVNVTHFLLA
jgi:HD-GYP domain-containing protein (c-di-GMP phosphodiesterase class II)